MWGQFFPVIFEQVLGIAHHQKPRLGKKPLNWDNYDTKLRHNTCTDTLHLVPKSRVLHIDFFVEVTEDGQAMLDYPYGGNPSANDQIPYVRSVSGGPAHGTP